MMLAKISSSDQKKKKHCKVKKNFNKKLSVYHPSFMKNLSH